MAKSKPDFIQPGYHRPFWSIGEPFVWFTASTLTFILVMMVILISVVIVNGLGIFWPGNLMKVNLKDGTQFMGLVVNEETAPGKIGQRIQLKIGNRDMYGLDFKWVDEEQIVERSFNAKALVVERSENGNFHGFLTEIHTPQHEFKDQAAETNFEPVIQQVRKLQETEREIDAKITQVNRRSERLRLDIESLKYKGTKDSNPELIGLLQELNQQKNDFNHFLKEQTTQRDLLKQYRVELKDVQNRPLQLQISQIVRWYAPNAMNWFEKVVHYKMKLWELLAHEPRESNTEGGLFPAIFGTITLIFIMSIFCFPFGVMTAIYLREYAKEGFLVKFVRIAVNNLAGIPSIVYGVFGLGFFVYGVGHSIDKLFFASRLPTPTFGTGGVLWGSLTLALLTLPVVIVATEEALGAVPKGMREASLALGGTRLQTITRVLLPMASPGIMTGFILAMARAAGEVAPLMITGVVKLAPSLAIDLTFPYVHLERKFMHLGFHIYDVGFQSPNVEAAKPMVFVTTLLLVLIVLMMSSVAIKLRNSMKKKYTLKSF